MKDAASEEIQNVRIEFAGDGSTTVVVKSLGQSQYELLEHPTFSVQAQYGDVILANEKTPQVLLFKQVVKKSPLEMVAYQLSEVTVESKPLCDILQDVMQSRGFWQCDLGCLLWVFFDRNKFDPRDQIEAIKNIKRAEL